MKVLNCANCGANLSYNIGSPVAFCQYCNSVNILENIHFKIDNTNAIDGPPSFYEELKPRIMLPQEKFMANYWEGSGNSQGGRLWISDTEIFFKPHAINIGNLSKKYMKISEIINMEKVNAMFGLSRELHITDKNGNLMELVSWNRGGIIASIETRKRNLI
jgi:hypothetical protein